MSEKKDALKMIHDNIIFLVKKANSFRASAESLEEQAVKLLKIKETIENEKDSDDVIL